MLIENESTETICVGDTMVGPPRDKTMILEPGQKLFVPDVLPGLLIAFATTPDGLRMAVRMEQETLWIPGNGHA